MYQDEFTARLLASRDFLSRYAYSLTKNATIADDIVQETMLKALQAKDSFRSDDNFNGWLASIMRNTYLNLLAKEQRYTDIDEYNCYDGYTYKDTSVEYNDLKGLVESLPKKFSQPFIMHVNGYKYTEIASELFLPLTTVKDRIHTAKKTQTHVR